MKGYESWEENLKATPAVRGNRSLATDTIAFPLKGKRTGFLTDQLIGYISRFSHYFSLCLKLNPWGPPIFSVVGSSFAVSSYETLSFHNTAEDLST